MTELEFLRLKDRVTSVKSSQTALSRSQKELRQLVKEEIDNIWVAISNLEEKQK